MGKTVEKDTSERPAGRMSAGDRRQQILDVAIRLFSQKGFRGTTTKEIALAAGVNEAIIFRHFATKKELYAAILDKKACMIEEDGRHAETEEAMQQGDDRKALESIAFHILQSHERDDAFMRLLLYSALEGHELAEMFYRTQITRYYRELADYFARRMEEGKLRRGDPMMAVRAFIGMVVYHAQMNKFYGRDLLNISNQEAAEHFTDIFLAGMTATEQESTEQPSRRSRRRRPELN
jgi:AcrR family transcriptional regulator